MKNHRAFIWTSLATAAALTFILTLVVLSQTAAAIDISNLDVEIGDSLGVGQVAGGLIIVVAVVLCADMILGVMGAPVQSMLLVDVMLVGVLTAIGWADAGIFIIILLIVALLFAPKIAALFWPGSDG